MKPMIQEKWKTIKNFDGIYEVSNLGRVRSVDRKGKMKSQSLGYVARKYNGKMIAQNLDSRGMYFIVHLSKNGNSYTKLVHRLVAEAFIENPTGLPEVNHIDENKRNNAVTNLEWCDHAYNNNYGTKRGSTRGQNNPQAKITEETVLAIRDEYVPRDKSHGITPLARKYGISVSQVCGIVKHKKWGWLV